MQRRRFLGALLAGGILSGCRKGPSFPPIPAGSTVLAFGDSVTFGTGAQTGEDWPTLLAAKTGWKVINAGVPGDTAEAGQHRLPALLEEHRPALTIVEIGGNDFLRRRPPASVKEALRRIVQQLRTKGSQVVLIGVPEPSLVAVMAGRVSDSPIYRDLADEEKIPLIPDILAEVLSSPGLVADRIHPNAAGYRQMADAMHARLRELGLSN